MLELVRMQTLLCCVFVFVFPAFRKCHSKIQTQTRLSSSQNCGMQSKGLSAQLPRATAIISTPLQTSRKGNFDSRPVVYGGCGFITGKIGSISPHSVLEQQPGRCWALDPACGSRLTGAARKRKGSFVFPVSSIFCLCRA